VARVSEGKGNASMWGLNEAPVCPRLFLILSDLGRVPSGGTGKKQRQEVLEALDAGGAWAVGATRMHPGGATTGRARAILP
jgi:hypothetical protein